MANFDVSIGGNQSEIKYFDNGTHLICTWNNLYLQDQQDVGSFTFQAILQNTGLSLNFKLKKNIFFLMEIRKYLF
jgi:hypothetical protein